MKEEMKKKFICEWCEKEYSQEYHYKNHIATCKKKPECIDGKGEPIPDKFSGTFTQEVKVIEGEDLKKKLSIDELEEFIGELVPPLHQQIFEWFDALNGRISANQMEIDRMIGWYTELYPNAPYPGGYGCTRCVQHVYNTLKKLYVARKGQKKCNNC